MFPVLRRFVAGHNTFERRIPRSVGGNDNQAGRKSINEKVK
jgi:hypothetical protein